MYNVGYRIVNNEEEAEDVLQEAFISAFRNLKLYRGEATFGAWLKRIVVNKAINQLKKNKMDRFPDDERWDVREEEVKDDTEGFPFTVEKVKNAIKQLPDGYRAVLSLYLLEGYDHGEIAGILDITESTSKFSIQSLKKEVERTFGRRHDMKDSLKDFIDRNRQAFDDQEPSGKIWENIKSSLPGMRQSAMWNSIGVWRAAAILFLGLSVYFFVTRSPGKIQRNDLAKSQVEFTDLEFFYSNQIAEKVALINGFDATGESDQFTQDFQKLDAMYQVLREEMKNHPSDKVKDALVLNLLVRIDLLNQQIKRLEDSKRPAQKTKAAIV